MVVPALLLIFFWLFSFCLSPLVAMNPSAHFLFSVHGVRHEWRSFGDALLATGRPKGHKDCSVLTRMSLPICQRMLSVALVLQLVPSWPPSVFFEGTGGGASHPQRSEQSRCLSLGL